MPQQSVWFDEWLLYVALPCETLLEYLRNLFVYLVEIAITPVHLALFYASAAIVDGNVPTLRLLSLVPGIISILLIYVLALRLGGRHAGLVAALCLALSPQHIWHNQEIRPYSLLFMLCLLALLGLIYWRDTGRRRWIVLNFLANGLLIFTHLFGVLFLLPQGLYLLGRREYKIFLRWAVAHVVFILPLLLAILVKPHLSEAYHPDLGLPFVAMVFRLFPSMLLRSFCADVLRWHTGFWPWFESGTSVTPASWLRLLLWIRPVLDWVLTALLLGSIAVLGFIGGRRNTPEQPPLPRADRLLLFSIIFVPSVILAILTLITSANFSDYGHDIYATIGVYIAVGIVFSRLSRRVFIGSVMLLVGLYGYQCLLFLPGGTRSDWRSGASYIKENASPEDLILDLWWNGPISRKEPYFSDATQTFRRVNTLLAVAEEADSFFDTHVEPEEKGNTHLSVWLLAETRFWLEWFRKHDFMPLLTDVLHARDLSFSVREFPGGFNLTVIKIFPTPDSTHSLTEDATSCFWTFDYEQILHDIGIPQTDDRRKQEMLHTLEQTIGAWPGVSAMGRVTYPLDLLLTGDMELAEAMAKHIITENPSFGLGYLALALVWAAEGESQRALAAYHSARSYHLGLGYFFGTYFEDLCKRNDMTAARESLEEVNRLKIPIFYETAAWVVQAVEKRIHNPGDIRIPMATPDPAVHAPQGNEGQTEQNKQYTFSANALPIQKIWEHEEKFESGPRWINAIFDKQENRSRLAQWMPLHKYVRISSAEVYSRLTGNASNALDIYQNLLNHFPFEKILYDRYDQILLSLNEPAAYISGWKKRSAYNPELAPFAAEKLSEAGKRWYASGNADAAILAYATACELDTENTHYKLRLAQLYDLCDATDEALRWYCFALQGKPYLEAVLDRVALLTENIDSKNRIDIWKDLFENHPDNWRMGMLCAQAFEAAKEYADAAEIYHSIGKHHPNQADTRLARCRCLRLSGKLKQARLELDEAAKRFPEEKALFAYEFIELGQSFARESEHDKAEECFNEAIRLKEHEGLAYFGLGEMLLGVGKVEKSINALRQSINYHPENSWYRSVLAQAEESLGDVESALADYAAAFRLSPDEDAIAERLDALIQKIRDTAARLRFWQALAVEFPDSETIRFFLEKAENQIP